LCSELLGSRSSSPDLLQDPRRTEREYVGAALEEKAHPGRPKFLPRRAVCDEAHVRGPDGRRQALAWYSPGGFETRQLEANGHELNEYTNAGNAPPPRSSEAKSPSQVSSKLRT
jgi:hypothetical protein